MQTEACRAETSDLKIYIHILQKKKPKIWVGNKCGKILIDIKYK